jgi:uncharacterized protein (DUF2252 family)
MTNPDDRQRMLTQTRNLKTAQSAHAYVRGSTVEFYEWLESSSRGKLPEGPSVWICGDCHVGNLGPLSVVELLGLHEAAYLEHCRRFALSEAA